MSSVISTPCAASPSKEIIFTPSYSLRRTPPPDCSSPLESLLFDQQLRAASSYVPTVQKSPVKVPQRSRSLLRSISNISAAASTAASRSHNAETRTPSVTSTKAPFKSRLPLKSPTAKAAVPGQAKNSAPSLPKTSKRPTASGDTRTVSLATEPFKTPNRNMSMQASSGGVLSATTRPMRAASLVRERVLQIESPERFPSSPGSNPATPTRRIHGSPSGSLFEERKVDAGGEDEITPKGPLPKLEIVKRTITTVDAGTSPMKPLMEVSAVKMGALANVQPANAVQTLGKGIPTSSVNKTPSKNISSSRMAQGKEQTTSEIFPHESIVSPIRARRHLPLARRPLPATPSVKPSPAFIKILQESAVKQAAPVPVKNQLRSPTPSAAPFTPPGKIAATTMGKQTMSNGTWGRRSARRGGAADLLHKIWTGRTPTAERGISFYNEDKYKIRELTENLHCQISSKREKLSAMKGKEVDLEAQLRAVKEDMQKEEGELLALMNAVALCEHCV